MSLYGALFSGVSGLKAQSTAIAVISDNISNVNTVGYKGGRGIFQTLVTNAGGGTAYSPGGVIGGSRQLVSQQGLLQATNSPTDIAIAGSGMFVVNSVSDGTGTVAYTRAGAFTQDATGNFRNGAGFFLQAWPLDRAGRLPGEPGNTENTISSANLSSLRTVNVQDLTGVAAATTTVALGANLKASETVFPGSGLTMSMTNDGNNGSNKASDIIIPQGSGNFDSLTRGDQFNISTSANTTGYDFIYGGIAEGRSVLDGTGGDYGTTVLGAGGGETTLGATPFSVTSGSAVVTVTHASHGLVDGDVVDLSGNLVAVGGIPAADFNGTFIVDVQSASTYTITVDTSASSTTTGGTTGIIGDVRPFDDGGFILDAASTSQNFLSATGTSIFAEAALSFTIATTSIPAVTFTYKGSAPNAQNGEFSNMNNLVDAINAVDGLTARIDNATGKLYVSAIDASEAITFTNGEAAGTDGDSQNEALYGIDWIRELGLVLAADNGVIAAEPNRFSTMQGLADLVNAIDELTATITSPLSDSDLLINIDDPLATINFTDADYGGSPNIGSVLAAMGLEDIDSFDGVVPSGTPRTSGDQGPAYDATDADKNMATGAITPQFSRSIRVFDSLGTGHDISVAFIKTAINTWAVEVFAIDSTEVTAANGLLASGEIVFNGDGTLQSVSSGLVNAIDVVWATSGAEDSEITFNWGTAGAIGTGESDGLSQFDSAYKVSFANQNGAPVGELTGVSIDEEGFVTASYSNGEAQRLFKIPLASFANPDALEAASGNVFTQTTASGEVNLVEAGGSGSGKIASSSLEASNIDLADELTTMIVAQRAYQANTKIISTASTLLDELNRAIT